MPKKLTIKRVLIVLNAVWLLHFVFKIYSQFYVKYIFLTLQALPKRNWAKAESWMFDFEECPSNSTLILCGKKGGQGQTFEIISDKIQIHTHKHPHTSHRLICFPVYHVWQVFIKCCPLADVSNKHKVKPPRLTVSWRRTSRLSTSACLLMISTTREGTF